MTADRELLEAWCSGDQRSGEALFARYVATVTRFFRNKAPEPDVPDLVAQTFLGISSAKDRFRQESSFRQFVYAIAHNVLREFIRKRYKRQQEALDFGTLCIAALDPRSQSSIVVRQRELQAFIESLRELPLDDQIVLELRYFEGLTGPEIADALELPEGTVRGRIARALDRLRLRIAERLRAGLAGASPSPDELDVWASEIRMHLGSHTP